MKALEQKTLIIPDVHQNIKWANDIINNNTFEHCVFLGDFFDTFNKIDNETYYSIEKTCEWINENLEDDRFTWLIGNHDLAYIAGYTPTGYAMKNNSYFCSGWTRNKQQSFNKSINQLFFDKIELCCQVGNYICSHAGFIENHFAPYLSPIENVKKLHKLWQDEKYYFQHQAHHWIGSVSPYRGGRDSHSSPLWLDWEEFRPVRGLKQIVGHTTLSTDQPREKLGNFCIDGYQNLYAIWDGELKFKSQS